MVMPDLPMDHRAEFDLMFLAWRASFMREPLSAPSRDCISINAENLGCCDYTMRKFFLESFFFLSGQSRGGIFFLFRSRNW